MNNIIVLQKMEDGSIHCSQITEKGKEFVKSAVEGGTIELEDLDGYWEEGGTIELEELEEILNKKI